MSKHTSPVREAKTESKKFGSGNLQFSTKPDFDINVPVTDVRPVLPWPEWSDIDVTNENWDCKTPESRRKQSTRSNATSNTQLVLFKDDHLKLPVSLIVYDWKRPSDLFTIPDECVLFVDRNEISVHDLIAENQHIIHSDFIRSVLASILTVWHLGSNGRFPIEGETPTFVSNTKHLSWRPWHHVYSMCKAGKNNKHNPQINPSGKYIVRLYFMGSWRKILVDDQIPVNIEDNILLPLTTERNELWVLLLTKALMKLASVTWTSDREIVEFNPILCLTGWVVQERNINGMSVDDVWMMCNNFVNQFSSAREKRDANNEMSVKKHESTVDPTESKRLGKSKDVIGKKNSKGVSSSRVDKDSSKSIKESRVSTQRKSSLKQSQGSVPKGKSSSVTSSKAKSRSFNGSRKGSSKGRTYSDTSRTKTSTKKITEETNVNRDPVLLAHLSDNWPMANRQTPAGVALSLSHSFLVLQTRDTPFVCQKPRPGVPGWKRYRWINWATKLGIFDPDILLPFRSLQIVSVFSDWIDKIEEKDNQIATTGTALTEGAHASGDPGGTDKLAQNLSRASKVEPIIDNHSNKTAESTPKANPILVSNDQDGTLKKATTLQRSDSKKTIVTTASDKSKKGKNSMLKKATSLQGSDSKKTIVTTASGKSKHGYLETIFSHRSMQYINPEETGITKCGASIWTDFNHIWNSLDKMLVYYKPSAFRYKINISNFILNRETPVARKRSVSDKKSLIEAVQYVIVPYTTQQSRNDGVYMAFDSVECIKVIFVLSSIPGHTLRRSKSSLTGEKRDEDYVDNSYTLIPPKKTAPVNVIIEVYNWSSNRFNETVLVLESVGTKSSTITLGPGRHVLRVWVKTDTAFILQCHSESAMIAGNLFKVVNTMYNYSERMTSFLQQMRNKFSYMILTFGKAHFVNAMHAVFQNINTISTKQKNNLVHEVFMHSVLETLKHFIGTQNTLIDYIFTLRVLFLNMSLGLEKKRKIPKEVLLKIAVGSYSEGASEEKQVIDYDKYAEGDSDTLRMLNEPGNENRYEDAAYLIQASWKRYCVLKLIKIHRNTHTKEHKLIVEKMRKIHEALFASVIYGDVIYKILRSMFELEPEVAQWLPLHNDFGRIVKTEEFQGLLVNISPNMWLPVARMIVYCHSDTPMIGAVNVICQFSTYMVRVINNDNLLENPRTVFNVDPCTYSKNENGYTIFVYAWSESIQKEVQWKLQIVTLKESPNLHPCTFLTKAETCTVNKPPALVTLEISNYYIPNRENVMCRLLILVKSKMLVSFRLTSSFKGVKFTACLQDKDRFPLVHAHAEEGAVIIPAVLLDIDNDSVETLYILEAKVVNNSWPLTRQEWIVQERLQNEYVTHRERSIVYKATSRLNMSNGTLKKMDLPKVQIGLRKRKDYPDEFPVEEPFWMVQIVVDYPQRDLIKVKQDRRREEAVTAMKKAWESADPGRAKRGHNLRSVFIREMYGTEHDKTSSVRQIHIREKVFDSKNVSTVKVNVLDDESTERFLEPPEEFAIAQSKAHFLKTVSEYWRVGSEKNPAVKTRESHERELLHRRKYHEEFLEAHKEDVDERGRMLDDQRRKHALMYAYYDGARLQSNRILTATYRVRDDYVLKKMEEEEVRKRIEALREKLGKKLSSKKSSRKPSAKKKLSSKKGSRKSSAKKKGKK